MVKSLALSSLLCVAFVVNFNARSQIPDRNKERGRIFMHRLRTSQVASDCALLRLTFIKAETIK